MGKVAAGAIVWTLVAASFAASLDRPPILFGEGSERPPEGYVLGGVNPHIEGTVAGFHVSVDFEVLPQPLKPARATVTMTADSSVALGHDVQNWRLEIGSSEMQVEWLSDRFVDFPGPVEPGDMFKIPVEFVTRVSGQVGFNIHWAVPKIFCDGCDLGVVWCLGKDGELMSLVNPRWGSGSCWNLAVSFFDQDSVRIISSSGEMRSYDMFTGDCKIVPPFRIGEPSTVCYRIVAVEDHPDGIDLEISYDHMVVTDYPEPIKGPVYAGDSLLICFTATPLPVREKHGIALTTYDDDPETSKWVMKIESLFADDGSLRYIRKGYMGFVDDDPSYLPKSYPSGTKATCGSHWIKRDQ